MEKGIPCNNKMQCSTFTFTGFSKKAIPRHSFMSLAPVCRKVFLKMSQQKVNIHLVYEHKHNPKLNLFDEARVLFNINKMWNQIPAQEWQSKHTFFMLFL